MTVVGLVLPTAPARRAMVVGLALVGCQKTQVWPALQDRVGDAPVTIRRAADRSFLATERGNLARAPAFTPEERSARFAEFLNDFRGEVGLSADIAPIEFRAAARQVGLAIGDEPMHTVYLVPLHGGASVVDRPQSAAYDAASGELRAVLAWAVEFATLPRAPLADTVAQERARAAFLDWLQARDAPEGRVAIRADPVIAAQLRRAGYLMEYRGRDETGAGSWIRALFDPAAEEVLILQHEERDDFPESAGAR